MNIPPILLLLEYDEAISMVNPLKNMVIEHMILVFKFGEALTNVIIRLMSLFMSVLLDICKTMACCIAKSRNTDHNR